MSDRKNIDKGIREMCEVQKIEKSVQKLKKDVFRGRNISAETFVRIRKTCRETLSHKSRSVAIRAELFVVFYLIQPEVLFHRCKISDQILNYVKSSMNLQKYTLSKYKANLLFLYLNDTIFREVVNDLINTLNTSEIETIRMNQ